MFSKLQVVISPDGLQFIYFKWYVIVWDGILISRCMFETKLYILGSVSNFWALFCGRCCIHDRNWKPKYQQNYHLLWRSIFSVWRGVVNLTVLSPKAITTIMKTLIRTVISIKTHNFAFNMATNSNYEAYKAYFVTWQ